MDVYTEHNIPCAISDSTIETIEMSSPTRDMGDARDCKSTIAKAIYEQIGPYFEGKCFLKVGDVWEQNHGQVSLQKKIILDIDKATEIEIPTIESGREILKERLRHKRVLLVLDDVNKLEQLNALCGSREWFGAGSKIIITTKDRQLLNEHGVDHIYRVKELDESESLTVFNLGAFSQETTPGEDFGKLSRQLVAYCGGLPLALEKLGSFFNGHGALQWDGVLRSPEGFSIPVQEVLKDLEKSFSDLSDEEKHIFLHIACFSVGKNQNDVLQTSSMQRTTLQIALLEDKSFITIDDNNNLEMHVLLQVMAKDIVKRKSSKTMLVGSVSRHRSI